MTILQLLIESLMKHFTEAGFEIPANLTDKQREAFVIHALENATIVPDNEYSRLVNAARAVVNQWSTNRLAEAVRNLDAALAQETKRSKLSTEPSTGICVIYSDENGHITDFGNNLELNDANTGTRIGEVPRYGVWKMSGGRHQVVHTTDDFDEAKDILSGKTSK